MKIFRVDQEIKLEKIDNSYKDEGMINLGEIIIKENKYHFKPNIIEKFNDKSNINFDGVKDRLSWLVYKGKVIPKNKSKYRIKEGDIIKLGREWLLIKDIHLSSNTKKKIKNNNKGKVGDSSDILLSFHTQTNQSLNLNDDFNNFEKKETEEIFKEYLDKENLNNNDKNNDNKIKNSEVDNNNNIINQKNVNINNGDAKKDEDLISCESDKTSEINKKRSKKICRICYVEEIDGKNNPLIKPCKCSGSMKYIHYGCLLHWLKTKVLISNNGFFSIYSLQLIECELCKKKLPNYIRHKNKIYNLLDLEKKFDDEFKKPKNKKENDGDINIFNQKKNQNDYNYIIFDTVTPDKKDNRYRYLVKFEKNNIMKIGRALEMQLILNDISVSRNHCQLKLEEDGSIFLEDNNSKFGTLVLIQAETLEILKGNILTVQVGTNFLNFELNKKKNLFGCCDAEEIDIKHSYEKINYKAIKYDKTNEILNESITPINSDNEEEEKKKDMSNKNKELIDEDENKNVINNNNNNIDSVPNGSMLAGENNINKENKNSNNGVDIQNKDI
mgnify:CR=1 FL=1